MKNEDIYYQAMLARDHRFDGKFFVGVKTTGIYCRPICPAKPKKENVEFFPNYLAAERAGYRPCLRCRPESAPGSAVWIGKSAIVRRAVKLINNPETLTFNEDQFAEKFGVSARHLRRVFQEETGTTPKKLAFENRLNLARKLITETPLPMTEIAYASGFNSLRRFNDAFKLRFKRSPSEVRGKKITTGPALCLNLPYRPPFDYKGLLAFYQNHQTGSLERFEDGTMVRIISYGGKCGQIKISNDEKNSWLRVEIDFPETTHIPLILSKVRALFDLDSDPVLVSNVFDQDPCFRKLLKKYPGTRLPAGWDPFEVAVSTILGQLVSVSQGRDLVHDLIDLLGTDSGLEHKGKPIKLFPSPRDIAEGDLNGLRTTKNRKETLKTFSRAVIDQELSLEGTQDIEEFYKSALSLKGVGPWSAQYMALRALQNTDAFPKTDLILDRAIKNHKLKSLDHLAPWRGYAAVLLWREHMDGKTKRKIP